MRTKTALILIPPQRHDLKFYTFLGKLTLLIFSKRYEVVVYEIQILGDLIIISCTIRDVFSTCEFCSFTLYYPYEAKCTVN